MVWTTATTRKGVFLSFLTLVVGCQVVVAANPGLEYCEGLFLVEANVMRVGEQEGHFVGMGTITNCFTGNLDAVNRSFQLVSSDRPADPPTAIIYPILRQQELMLCFVRKNGAKLEHVAGGGYGFKWPVRRALDPQRFKRAQSQARAMARVSQTGSESEKHIVLTELFASPESSVGAWAGRQLKRPDAKIPTPPDFYREQLDNDSLSVGATMELDDALLKFDGKEWQHSEQRLEIFKRLVSAAHPDHEAILIFIHLRSVTLDPKNDGFALEPLFMLLRAAMNNDQIPHSVKKKLASLVSAVAQQYDDDELAFQFAIETITNSDHPEIQREMTRVLRHFFEPSDERSRIVVSLMYQLMVARERERIVKETQSIESDNRCLP